MTVHNHIFIFEENVKVGRVKIEMFTVTRKSEQTDFCSLSTSIQVFKGFTLFPGFLFFLNNCKYSGRFLFNTYYFRKNEEEEIQEGDN